MPCFERTLSSFLIDFSSIIIFTWRRSTAAFAFFFATFFFETFFFETFLFNTFFEAFFLLADFFLAMSNFLYICEIRDCIRYTAEWKYMDRA